MILKKLGVRTLGVATLALAASFASAQEIGVQVNNESVKFKKQTPVYVSGRVLIPLRGVLEKMGATVKWEASDRLVTATKGQTEVSLHIGEKWASVSGQTLAMDVPAQIINGSTMVPIRFVSEALGAQVSWNDETRLVSIYSFVAGDKPEKPKTTEGTRRFVLSAGSVIPVTLQTRISSRDSKVGDLFRASIGNFNSNPENWDNNRFHFPTGSVLEGRLVSVISKEGDTPGIIEPTFGTIVLPDGRATKIVGSLVALDAKNVSRDNNGVLVAKKSEKDNRMVYAGYGAGAGLVIGLLTKQPLEKTAIGGLLGYLVGTLSQSEKQAKDVHLEPGTEFGVRLDAQAAISLTRNSSTR